MVMMLMIIFVYATGAPEGFVMSLFIDTGMYALLPYCSSISPIRAEERQEMLERSV